MADVNPAEQDVHLCDECRSQNKAATDAHQAGRGAQRGGAANAGGGGGGGVGKTMRDVSGCASFVDAPIDSCWYNARRC